MKFSKTIIAVSDVEKSRQFYHDVLGLEVIAHLGKNTALSGGLCLQPKSCFPPGFEFEDNKQTNTAFELYFDEPDFDKFIEKLSYMDIKYLHSVKQHNWGQRIVRFYDPDMNIIEVGESLNRVIMRYFNTGMSVSEISLRMDISESFVLSCVR